MYEKDGDSSYYCFMKGGGMFSECGADDMEMTTASPPSGGNDGGDGEEGERLSNQEARYQATSSFVTCQRITPCASTLDQVQNVR